jgi:hypothetical protein
MVVVCGGCVGAAGFKMDLQMFSSESQSRCFALLSNDAASAFAAEDKVYKINLLANQSLKPICNKTSCSVLAKYHSLKILEQRRFGPIAIL